MGEELLQTPRGCEDLLKPIRPAVEREVVDRGVNLSPARDELGRRSVGLKFTRELIGRKKDVVQFPEKIRVLSIRDGDAADGHSNVAIAPAS